MLEISHPFSLYFYDHLVPLPLCLFRFPPSLFFLALWQIVFFHLFIRIYVMVRTDLPRGRDCLCSSCFATLTNVTWIKLQLSLLREPEFPPAILVELLQYFHLQTHAKLVGMVEFLFATLVKVLTRRKSWEIDRYICLGNILTGFDNLSNRVHRCNTLVC